MTLSFGPSLIELIVFDEDLSSGDPCEHPEHPGGRFGHKGDAAWIALSPCCHQTWAVCNGWRRFYSAQIRCPGCHLATGELEWVFEPLNGKK